MSLIKWSPIFDSFEDMDAAFRSLTPSLRGVDSFMPAIDMYEDNDAVIVETQLAGIDPDKVDIAIEHDTLTIRGEGEKQHEVDEKNYYRKEIRRGSFYRTISLPTHVDGDKAKAIAEAGVLKITIPKVEISQPNKIKIQKK